MHWRVVNKSEVQVDELVRLVAWKQLHELSIADESTSCSPRGGIRKGFSLLGIEQSKKRKTTKERYEMMFPNHIGIGFGLVMSKRVLFLYSLRFLLPPTFYHFLLFTWVETRNMIWSTMWFSNATSNRQVRRKLFLQTYIVVGFFEIGLYNHLLTWTIMVPK